MEINLMIAKLHETKQVLARYKTQEKKEVDELKDIMRKEVAEKDGKRIYENEGFKVTITIQDKSTMNEEKLIKFLKKNKLNKGIVKRREYVDSDALENAIYNGIIPKNMLVEMDKCKEPNFIEVLKLTKKKKKED